MSGEHVWPDFNPFPFAATTTTPTTSAELTDPPSGSVTFLFPHVIHAGDLVHDYLRTYKSDAAGRVAMLNGEHGSGKSHTIRHLVDRIVHSSWQNPEFSPAVKLVAKAVNANFMDVYRTLIGQIDLDLLRSVGFDSKNALAGRQWVRASSDAAKGLIQDRLRTEKGAALDALLRYLVDPDAVEADQQRELVKAGVGYEDFQRVLPFILGKDLDLATVAHAWLASKPLLLEDLRKLGVNGPIASLDVCVSALQLVAILFSRASRPLLVFLDQFEKLTKEGEATPEQIVDNISVLRQLVDSFLDNGAFLIVAGTNDAWCKFADDLKARFRAGLVNFPRLTHEQTRDVIVAYITAARRVPTRSSIFPFDDEGLEVLYRFSRGTLRALLQAAHALYNEAAKRSPRTTIDAAAVDGALAREVIQPPATVDDVNTAVQRLLEESGLDWRTKFEVGDFVAQYAVVDAEESPRLVVHVMSAVFHDDEVQNAQRLVATIRDWQRTRETTPRVGLILTGYVSDRVLGILGGVRSVKTVVYDPATFRGEVGELLAAARRVPRRVTSRSEEAKLKVELDQVRGELQSVRTESDGKVVRLEQRLQEVLALATPVASARSVIYERWRDERRELEREIEGKRADRARNRLDQLRRGAKSAEQLRTRRLITMSVVLLTMITLLSVFLRLRLNWVSRPSNFEFALGLNAVYVGAASAAMVFAYFLLVYYRLLQPNAVQVAAGPIESLEELDHLRFHPRQVLTWVSDPNPQIRYVAWRSRVPRYGSPVELDHFEREPVPLVRRAAAEALSSEGSSDRSLRVSFDVRETAYLVENERVDLSSAPRDMLLVARIAEAHRGAPYLQVFQLLASGHAQEVEKAFASGRLTGADVIGRQTCRAAISALSPLDDGLGTLDDLRCITTVDELFLYFKRELFFADRGVSQATAASERNHSH